MHAFASAQQQLKQAVDAFAATADSFPDAKWHAPRQAGKWSAAEITVHLIKAFEAGERELKGGGPMQMRLAGWKLLYARWIVLRRMLKTRAFPTGARAPRETRPEDALPGRTEAVKLFRAAAASFERATAAAYETRPRTTLTHPYFGGMGLADSVLLAAIHIEHHHKQIMVTDDR